MELTRKSVIVAQTRNATTAMTMRQITQLYKVDNKVPTTLDQKDYIKQCL